MVMDESGAQPYPEDDKLGPLGGNAHLLADPARLRAVMVEEFRRAADAARHASTDLTAGTTVAVHSFRKALRHARAVLELSAGALSKGEASTLRRALRDARRSVSTVRDHAVAPEALATLELGPDERQVADAVLASAAAGVPTAAEIAQLLAEGAAAAATQAEAFEAALPATLEWSTIADGLAGVYRTARRARRRGKRSRRGFHTWRRRTKELAYQLELFARHAGARVAALRDRFVEISDRIGPTVDLIMLREYVATHGEALPAEGLAGLDRAIDAQLRALMTSTRKGSREAFARGGRKLARQVTRAIRRDLAPAEAPAEDDDHDGHDHDHDHDDAPAAAATAHVDAHDAHDAPAAPADA
jgi:CHAD domain-containing protein